MALDWVTCRVKLGNDMRNKVTRGAHNPVSWPELEILRHVHGDVDAVMDIEYLKTTSDTPAAEFQRLRLIYKEGYFSAVYPGRNPMQLPMQMPDELKPAPDPEPAAKSRGRPKKTETSAPVLAPGVPVT